MSAQGSPEWLAERLGKVTASRIADMMARTKSGWGASRANYAAQLVVERLTGTVQESYTNGAMQWGIETEPYAVSAYEFFRDVSCEPCGFIPHPTIPMAGCSPDRLIRSDGLVEVKCPMSATHIDTLLGKKIPEKYVGQMQFQMACTGRQWCDFVSFDPRMPEGMKLFVERLGRDDAYISEIETETVEFLKGVEETVTRLRDLYA